MYVFTHFYYNIFVDIYGYNKVKVKEASNYIVLRIST